MTGRNDSAEHMAAADYRPGDKCKTERNEVIVTFGDDDSVPKDKRFVAAVCAGLLIKMMVTTSTSVPSAETVMVFFRGDCPYHHQEGGLGALVYGGAASKQKGQACRSFPP
jgi:hypothetical protein